jgi:hypothetical protein
MIAAFSLAEASSLYSGGHIVPCAGHWQYCAIVDEIMSVWEHQAQAEHGAGVSAGAVRTRYTNRG